MIIFFLTALSFFFLAIVICGLAVLFAYLIALVVPALDITHTLTPGVLIAIFSVYFFGKIMAKINEFEDDSNDDQDSDTIDTYDRGKIRVITNPFVSGSIRKSKSRRPRKSNDE